MRSCRKTIPAKATSRTLRGPRMSSGKPISSTHVPSTDSFLNQDGSCCAYHATQVGRGWGEKWKASAARVRQGGSPQLSFTLPDWKVRRNSNHHRRKRTETETGGSGVRTARRLRGS